MKIIYYSQTGKYGALAAAGVHLDLINENIKYTTISSFFHDYNQPAYHPIYVGQDSSGTKVYALGITAEKDLIAKIMRSFKDTFYVGGDILEFVDAFPKLSIAQRLLPLPLLSRLANRIMPFVIWLNIRFIQKQIYKNS